MTSEEILSLLLMLQTVRCFQIILFNLVNFIFTECGDLLSFCLGAVMNNANASFANFDHFLSGNFMT